MKMTRCMLHEKDLPKRLWEKTANTVVCLQTRISTKAVNDRHYLKFGMVANLL